MEYKREEVGVANEWKAKEEQHWNEIASEASDKLAFFSDYIYNDEEGCEGNVEKYKIEGVIGSPVRKLSGAADIGEILKSFFALKDDAAAIGGGGEDESPDHEVAEDEQSNLVEYDPIALISSVVDDCDADHENSDWDECGWHDDGNNCAERTQNCFHFFNENCSELAAEWVMTWYIG